MHNHVCIFVVQESSTALEHASKHGHDEVVSVLLAAKATVNTQNKVSTEWSTCKQALSDVSFCMCSTGRPLSGTLVGKVTRNVLNC